MNLTPFVIATALLATTTLQAQALECAENQREVPFKVMINPHEKDLRELYVYSHEKGGDILLARGGEEDLSYLLLNQIVDNQWVGAKAYPDGTHTGDFAIADISMDAEGRMTFKGCLEPDEAFVFGVYGTPPNVKVVRAGLAPVEQCGDEECIDYTLNNFSNEIWEGWYAKGTESSSEKNRIFIQDLAKDLITAGGYTNADGTPINLEEVEVYTNDVEVLLGFSGNTFARPIVTGILTGGDTHNTKVVDGIVYTFNPEDTAYTCLPLSTEWKINGQDITDENNCTEDLKTYPDGTTIEQTRYGKPTSGVLKHTDLQPYKEVNTTQGDTCSISVEHESTRKAYTEFWQDNELKQKTEGNIADFVGDCKDTNIITYVLDHKEKPVHEYGRTVEMGGKPKITGMDLDKDGKPDIFDVKDPVGIMDVVIDIDCNFPINYEHTLIVDPPGQYTMFGENMPANMTLDQGALKITYNPSCSAAGKTFGPEFYVSGPNGTSPTMQVQYRVQ